MIFADYWFVIGALYVSAVVYNWDKINVSALHIIVLSTACATTLIYKSIQIDASVIHIEFLYLARLTIMKFYMVVLALVVESRYKFGMQRLKFNHFFFITIHNTLLVKMIMKYRSDVSTFIFFYRIVLF